MKKIATQWTNKMRFKSILFVLAFLLCCRPAHPFELRNGETLGRKIKEDPTLKDTVLVLTTSLGMIGDAARFKKIGFSAYLTKPVKQSILYDCLITVNSGIKSQSKKPQQPFVTRHSIRDQRRHKSRILLAEDNFTN